MLRAFRLELDQPIASVLLRRTPGPRHSRPEQFHRLFIFEFNPTLFVDNTHMHHAHERLRVWSLSDHLFL